MGPGGGLTFRVDVELPRRLKLTLLMRPRIRMNESSFEVQLAIPRVARSRLHVGKVADFQDLQVPPLAGQFR